MIAITDTRGLFCQKVYRWAAKNSGIDVMVRYVAFFVLGSAFVTGIVTMAETHRLSAEPKVLFTSTPVNYVDGHWPSSLPAMLRGPVSH